MLRILFSSAACALLVPASLAQSLTAVVRDGDVIAGVGAITAIDNLAVNRNGVWLVEAPTDNVNTNINTVLIKQGVMLWQEGALLAAPAGAGLSTFDAMVIDSNGHSGWNLFLDNMPLGQDSGLYWDGQLVILESSISAAPQFSAGTPYVGFFETKWNDLGQMLVVASVDDPAIASTVDRALVRVQLDALGALVSETCLVKEGDLVGGFPVTDMGTSPHEFALSNAGHWMAFVDTTDAAATDGIVMLDGAILAREGSPSPVAGRNYELLAGRPMDVNVGGHWVLRANLDGSIADDEVILGDGVVLVSEGQSLPAIGAFVIQSFGTGPVLIDSTGEVFWFGDWSDPVATRDTGLFVDHELLAQEGVTLVGGLLLQSISGSQDSFAISPDGRYVIFEGQLAGGVDAAILIDRGPRPEAFCLGTNAACPCANGGSNGSGCQNSLGTGAILMGSGTALVSADTFVLAGVGMPNSSALFFQGTGQSGGGSGVPFGDGLRCATGTVIRLGTKTNAGGASSYPAAGDLAISVKGALPAAGGTRHYQVWYRNAAAFCTTSTFNLSNGLSVPWQP